MLLDTKDLTETLNQYKKDLASAFCGEENDKYIDIVNLKKCVAVCAKYNFVISKGVCQAMAVLLKENIGKNIIIDTFYKGPYSLALFLESFLKRCCEQKRINLSAHTASVFYLPLILDDKAEIEATFHYLIEGSDDRGTAHLTNQGDLCVESEFIVRILFKDQLEFENKQDIGIFLTLEVCKLFEGEKDRVKVQLKLCGREGNEEFIDKVNEYLLKPFKEQEE